MVIRCCWLLAGFLPLLACSSYAPEIETVCLRDDIGNYIIKWETDPQIEGTMKLYVSDNPDSFDRANPVSSADIRNGVTTYVTPDNIIRKYFLLSFNDKYFREVGSRPVVMDSIQNFRDLGGYVSREGGKAVRWGTVYRSGRIGRLSERDSIRLDNLHVKTIIDLRTEDEVAAAPISYPKANVIHIPIPIRNYHRMLTRLKDRETRKGDAMLFMQDLYLHYVAENAEQFGQALAVFEDRANYPIVFNCSYGKDRAGFLAALLLLVLDVPEETILEDYLATNDNFDTKRYASLVDGLDSNGQETLTVLLTANESFMNLALNKIRKDYGSPDKYLKEKLHVTEEQQRRIKEILLF